MTWNKNELKELQREENKVWRFILRGPSFVAVAALRGDLGVSIMIYRDMRAKLKYARRLMNCEGNKLASMVFRDMFEKDKDKLVKTVRQYMDNG